MRGWPCVSLLSLAVLCEPISCPARSWRGEEEDDEAVVELMSINNSLYLTSQRERSHMYDVVIGMYRKINEQYGVRVTCTEADPLTMYG